MHLELGAAAVALVADQDAYSTGLDLYLCLSECPGQVATRTVSKERVSAEPEYFGRNAVSNLRFSRSAKWFAHGAISALAFSQAAGLVDWALLARC